VIRLAVAPRRHEYVRRAWFDLAIIVLSPPFLVPESLEPLRGLRALRLLRLVRVFSVAAIGLRAGRRVMIRQRLLFVTVVAVVTVLLGARAVFVAERGTNPNIGSLADALWWSIVTATTVGYGDVSPVTLEGRMIAVLLFDACGVAFTGLILGEERARHGGREDPDHADPDQHQRMAAIEAKLDDLLRSHASERRVGVGPSDSTAVGGPRSEG
jgi:voltage-gated potassium channel